MSSMRKMVAGEQAAYEKMTAARADLVAAIAQRNGSELCASTATPRVLELEDAQIARLRRRVGAYTAQWEAAARRVELATVTRETGQ